MEGINNSFNFPSGVQLPFIIRQKLQEQEAKQAEDDLASQPQDDVKFMTGVRPPSTDDKEDTQPANPENGPLPAKVLEDHLWKTSLALVEVQKQIHRGEEAYYEDTFGHGNIYKGWEGFLDAKDFGTASSSKPPRDSRWFSTSSSISRTSRPPAITTQLPGLGMQRPPLSNKTPTSVSSAALASTTPLEQNLPLSTTSVAAATTILPSAASTGSLAPSAAAQLEVSGDKMESDAMPASNQQVQTSTTDIAQPAPGSAPISVAAHNTTTSIPVDPVQIPAPAAASDSFKIPKKIKTGDSGSSPAAAADTTFAVAPPTESQQTASDEAEATETAGRARKRKAEE